MASYSAQPRNPDVKHVPILMALPHYYGPAETEAMHKTQQEFSVSLAKSPEYLKLV